MGAGLSQDEASQSQPSVEQTSSNSQSLIEAKPSEIEAKATDNTSEAKPNGTKAKEAEKALRGIHKLEEITKDADGTVEYSSPDKLLTKLQDGIFLNQMRKASFKYWIDRMANNCFMLYARDLSITWAEDNSYWRWPRHKEKTDEVIEVAELMNVCWLEVHGKLDTTKLSPGTLYEVAFVVMVKHPAYGWDTTPVNVALCLPDGSKQERNIDLSQQPMNQWVEIVAGKFRTSPEKLGEIQFSMYEYHGGKWKKGLVIKGVAIQPRTIY
ncbi:Phloem protein [Parasponia andersonii]|uniref:Phloem protein n=1 Tax=Parasponia andersonii TaxID=3476 RepID=A0A2P5B9V6_PARAD|nr:Phloem protein [Parasponia andersonii]